MKKRSFGRQLGRDKNQRRALFRGLAVNLVENGEVTTTLAKAKAIRSDLEKLITKAKNATLADRRMIFRYLGRRDLVNHMVESIGAVFKDRQGGYLRLVRVTQRRGDLAEMVKIMLTEVPKIKLPPKAEKLPINPEDSAVSAQPVIAKKPLKVTKKITQKIKDD